MDPLLSLQSLSVGYGGKQIVYDVSFDINAGELCALLGQNGSGKTTLLKGICGLLPLSGGRCISNGLDCSVLNEKERARQISYIPQRFSKLMNVNVLDVVMMGLYPQLGLFDFPTTEDKAAALSSLEKMEIPHLADDDFSRLSEGQKQLVILARALTQNAPVMLMDEPDSALDFQNKHAALAKIRKLIRDEDKTGLVTLHDPNLALAHCDRLILLHEGRVISEVRLCDSSMDEIRSNLSKIYDNITLIKHDGKYLVSLKIQ